MRKTYGFTLIEMLVVMVILSLTTALLASGLTTTWQNFDRLGARALAENTASLPKSWFSDSFEGALLYHPYTPLFFGSADELTFTTYYSPDTADYTPRQLTWYLEPVGDKTELAFSNHNQAEEKTVVATLSGRASFAYLHNGSWTDNFTSEQALLPDVVTVNDANGIWTFAHRGRPAHADIPQELPLFGEYEF